MNYTRVTLFRLLPHPLPPSTPSCPRPLSTPLSLPCLVRVLLETETHDAHFIDSFLFSADNTSTDFGPAFLFGRHTTPSYPTLGGGTGDPPAPRTWGEFGLPRRCTLGMDTRYRSPNSPQEFGLPTRCTLGMDTRVSSSSFGTSLFFSFLLSFFLGWRRVLSHSHVYGVVSHVY